jgi:protein-S-isoprenylcysteine O-methyltransferase Ste14
MASIPSADRPNVRIPPPLMFFIFLVIAAIIEFCVGPEFPKGPLGLRASIASLFLALAGCLALHAFVVFKKEGTAIDPGKPTTRIVNEGPFRYTRNPMYLSLVAFLLALAILFFSIWFLLAAVVLKILLDRLAIGPEEVYLQKKFGNRYREYMKRTRRWI